jgi:hypothetical protein
MAYNQSQGDHESSWSQQGQRDQSATPNHPWVRGSSEAEQSYTTTASSSGPVAFGRSWSNDTPAYASQGRPISYGRNWSDGRPIYAHQQHLLYHGQYKQTVASENHAIGNNGSPNPVGGSQDTHGGHYASPQTYTNPYQYVCALWKGLRFTDGVPGKKLLIEVVAIRPLKNIMQYRQRSSLR